jgi:hypothetical protein
MLRRLCAISVDALPIDEAALAVMSRQGHWGVVHATSSDASALEDLGFTLGESPSIDAFATHQPVLVSDLDGRDGERWPMYAQALSSHHCRAVFAFPLNVATKTLGTLTLYARLPTRLSEAQVAASTSVAKSAAPLVLDHLEGTVGPAPNIDQRPDRTFIRAEVYQASGMIMARLNVPIDEAMTRLRAYAYARDESINDVARRVVTRDLLFDDNTE